MSTELLQRPLDANSQRIFGLGTPTTVGDATYVDHTSTPQANGTASPGSSFLAAPADHVHPASGTSVNYDFLLTNDPASPTVNYTPTYTSGALTSEVWKNVAAQTIKQITYTYSSGLVATEVRQVYDVSTSTLVAQVTYTYTYSSGVLSSYTVTRDIGGPGTTPSIDTLLECDPVQVDMTLAVSYGAGYVSSEVWTVTSSGLTLIRSDYTYNLDLTVHSVVRKVYDSLGTTIIGQTTQTFAYSSGFVSGIAQTRDL